MHFKMFFACKMLSLKFLPNKNFLKKSFLFWEGTPNAYLVYHRFGILTGFPSVATTIIYRQCPHK